MRLSLAHRQKKYNNNKQINLNAYFKKEINNSLKNSLKNFIIVIVYSIFLYIQLIIN